MIRTSRHTAGSHLVSLSIGTGTLSQFYREAGSTRQLAVGGAPPPVTAADTSAAAPMGDDASLTSEGGGTIGHVEGITAISRETFVKWSRGVLGFAYMEERAADFERLEIDDLRTRIDSEGAKIATMLEMIKADVNKMDVVLPRLPIEVRARERRAAACEDDGPRSRVESRRVVVSSTRSLARVDRETTRLLLLVRLRSGWWRSESETRRSSHLAPHGWCCPRALSISLRSSPRAIWLLLVVLSISLSLHLSRSLHLTLSVSRASLRIHLQVRKFLECSPLHLNISPSLALSISKRSISRGIPPNIHTGAQVPRVEAL